MVRGDPASPEIITADLKSLIEEGNLSQNVVLASGDLVYVPRSGWGDINLYNKRIRPLFELIIWPARIVIDYYVDRFSNLASILTGGYWRQSENMVTHAYIICPGQLSLERSDQLNIRCHAGRFRD